tara:strand:+ start:8429 stop:10681 length:2253 start_codon:yes stop_codon:yes gene_type:complete
MAVTENTYTGNGSTTTYAFTFPYLKTSDIKASVGGSVTTAFTLPTATTLQFNTAPANSAAVRIYRETADTNLSATFYAGSSIKSQDLNDNFTQNLYVTQEANNLSTSASTTATTAKTTADTAITNAASATSTANTASTNATNAVSTANTASTNATNAVTTANSADTKADSALAAINTSAVYNPVANVAAIPASPSNGDNIQVTDSTGIESFSPLAGRPGSFTGASALAARISYSSSGSTWNWIGYVVNDPDARYANQASPTFTGNVTINAQGDIRLADSDSSNYVGFQSPATVASNVVWTLPASDGSASQVLKTDGSGALSWVTVSSSTNATTVTIADESSDTTCFPLFATGATGDLAPKSGSNLTFNSSTGLLTSTGLTTTNLIAGSLTYPTSDGSASQVLQTNGSGTLSFATVSSGGLTSSATYNTVGGTNAGEDLSGTATDNTLIGYDAGKDLADQTDGDEGSMNVAVGKDALELAQKARETVAIGNEALAVPTTGDIQANTAVGYRAMKGSGATDNRTYNVAVGYESMINTGDSKDNTCVGNTSGKSIAGDDNTCIGSNSGRDVTSGENNLLLGHDSGRSASPSGQITSGDNNVCLGDNDIANLYCADTSISSSDKRDKTDVVNFTVGLDWINKLQPVTYRWDKRSWYTEYNDDGSIKSSTTPDGTKKRSRIHIGFLAQDFIEVEKQFGYGTSKDTMLVANQNEDSSNPSYGLKYERLVPILTNAIKELSAKVTTLETKVAALEAG